MGSVQEYAEWVPHGAPKGAMGMLYRGAAQPTGGAKLQDRIQFAFGAQFVEVGSTPEPARSASPASSAPLRPAAS